MLLLSLAFILCGQSASAQQQVAVKPVSQAPSLSGMRADDTRYRIGPGDMLDIRVFNRPQFSRDNVRVDSSGLIRMPLIEGEIRAVCLTESELAAEIARRYQEFLREPQVDVFIKEYNSQPVAVIGAVRLPSRFQMTRRVRLLELLTFAGGLAENAGRSVQVVHTGAGATCNAAVDSEATSGLDNYELKETLKGTELANPFVQPGDVVSIPEAEQIFVVGNVFKPSAIPLREQITVTRAIAMAGGVMPDTKKDKIRIVRQPPGTIEKKEIFVDLRAVDKHQAEDVVLLAGDIVDVPESSGKKLLKSFLGAVVPSVGQLPIRVIP
ncbi:MAG: polysaccharide biosynthesis/export family protein [Acidobacteria bacterium]|nr:polysaccharide biosynthesis/export family protein [Acidobacteriota bacterium]